MLHENTAMALKETNSNEESLAGAEQVYLYLLWTRVSTNNSIDMR